MAGLPRSGGTLISSILNQNPDIYVSPHSVLLNILGSAYNQYQSNDNKDSDQSKRIYNVIENIIPSFYGNDKEKYIIDKNFSWLDLHPYKILEYHLRSPIKIICPVRNIMEILASWNRLCDSDPQNKYDIEINKIDKTKRNLSDKRADYFMTVGNSENGIVGSIKNIKNFLYSELKENIMLVDYDDLTINTKQTINKIYEFLNISYFELDLLNLSTPHIYTDSWGIKNHHKVKGTIQKENYELSNIFSPSIIKKYSGLEFWKTK
jgi:hypothetical protein